MLSTTKFFLAEISAFEISESSYNVGPPYKLLPKNSHILRFWVVLFIECARPRAVVAKKLDY